MTKYMLFFGSLRKNSKRGYNFDRFGTGSQKYLGDYSLEGFEMYDVGAYPTICEGDGNIKVELHEVTDYAAQRIEMMEQGAGYTSKTMQVQHGGKLVEAVIYFWNKDKIEARGLKRFESGDWQ